MGSKTMREPGTCPVCGYYLMTHEFENGLCGYCVERLQNRPLHAEIEKKKGICIGCHIRTAQPGKLICKTCEYKGHFEWTPETEKEYRKDAI